MAALPLRGAEVCTDYSICVQVLLSLTLCHRIVARRGELCENLDAEIQLLQLGRVK